MIKTDKNELVIGPVRLSYLFVFEPRVNKLKRGQPLEFSVTLLIPKDPTEHMPSGDSERKQIVSELGLLVKAKWGEKPGKIWYPVRDGDAEDAPYPGYWFIRAKSGEAHPPMLIDGLMRPVTSGWASGDWARVKVKPWLFDTDGNKGVSMGLQAIQFLYKGEALGSGESTADGFDEVKDAHTSTSALASPTGNSEYDPFADE
jgi:ssDNA-binding protein